MKEDLKYKVGSRVRYISQDFFDDVCEHCGGTTAGVTTTEDEGVIGEATVTHYASIPPVVHYLIVGRGHLLVREDKIIEVLE